eukprot:6935391-Prorocentrum_lima.AAC.1
MGLVRFIFLRLSPTIANTRILWKRQKRLESPSGRYVDMVTQVLVRTTRTRKRQKRLGGPKGRNVDVGFQ